MCTFLCRSDFSQACCGSVMPTAVSVYFPDAHVKGRLFLRILRNPSSVVPVLWEAVVLEMFCFFLSLSLCLSTPTPCPIPVPLPVPVPIALGIEPKILHMLGKLCLYTAPPASRFLRDSGGEGLITSRPLFVGCVLLGWAVPPLPGAPWPMLERNASLWRVLRWLNTS